jgi:NAD(P)H-flavin reductase/hemoglobin-like flavoprotein
MATDANSEYEQLLALHHAMQLRRSLRDDGPAPARRRPMRYPERIEDQALLVASLEAIVSPADEVVRSFYAKLFLGRAYLRGMFPPGLRAGSDRLFSALIGLADQLDRLDEMVPALEQLGRDHRKYGIRPAHYDAVRDAMIGALREHAGDGWRPEHEAAWRRAYGFAAGVMQAAEAVSTDPPYWQGTVVGHERRHQTIAVLRVRTDVPYEYRAGQYATVESPAAPRVWRQYSMATPPRSDGILEFHVRAVEFGRVSLGLVRDTGVGDQIRLGPPMGTAVLGEPAGRPLLVVAGGTGLAPCRAVTEEVLATQPGRPVQLVVGVRHTNEFYDMPALHALAERYRELALLPAVSDDPGFTGPRGALPDLIAASGPWNDHEIYACGPPGMVHALDRVLRDMKVPPEAIHHDPIPS